KRANDKDPDPFSRYFNAISKLISDADKTELIAYALSTFTVAIIRGNLKEYCCHKIDKRIGELLRKKSRKRTEEARKAELREIEKNNILKARARANGLPDSEYGSAYGSEDGTGVKIAPPLGLTQRPTLPDIDIDLDAPPVPPSKQYGYAQSSGYDYQSNYDMMSEYGGGYAPSEGNNMGNAYGGYGGQAAPPPPPNNANNSNYYPSGPQQAWGNAYPVSENGMSVGPSTSAPTDIVNPGFMAAGQPQQRQQYPPGPPPPPGMMMPPFGFPYAMPPPPPRSIGGGSQYSGHGGGDDRSDNGQGGGGFIGNQYYKPSMPPPGVPHAAPAASTNPPAPPQAPSPTSPSHVEAWIKSQQQLQDSAAIAAVAGGKGSGSPTRAQPGPGNGNSQSPTSPIAGSPNRYMPSAASNLPPVGYQQHHQQQQQQYQHQPGFRNMPSPPPPAPGSKVTTATAGASGNGDYVAEAYNPSARSQSPSRGYGGSSRPMTPTGGQRR
ncbi:hypothetical protein HDU76_008480, partial [Blyttiomyces sp. JEL0837]